MLTSYASRNEMGGGFRNQHRYLTRILLKSAFSFGGRVIVGIVVVVVIVRDQFASARPQQHM